MQASQRITPNTKCVTPARWGNRGAEHGADSNTEFFTDAPGDGCIGKTTEGKTMTSKTTAQKLASSKDINALWDQVDNVQRLTDGADLYTYPDGSQLKVSDGGITVIESPNT